MVDPGMTSNADPTQKVEVCVAGAMRVSTNRPVPFFCFSNSIVVELTTYRNEPQDHTKGEIE